MARPLKSACRGGRKSLSTVRPAAVLCGAVSFDSLLCVACIGMREANTMAVQPHRVSRDPNDGSRDDMQDNGYDEQRFERAKDQSADTRTTFYEQDIDDLDVSQRRKNELKRIMYRNEGQDYLEQYGERDDRKAQNRKEWKRRQLLTYANQMELTDTQVDRALHWMMDVLDINTFGRYSTEQVAVAVINVVAREDDRWIEDEDGFHDLMADNDIAREDGTPDMRTMRRLRGLVRKRIPSKCRL